MRSCEGPLRTSDQIPKFGVQKTDCKAGWWNVWGREGCGDGDIPTAGFGSIWVKNPHEVKCEESIFHWLGKNDK